MTNEEKAREIVIQSKFDENRIEGIWANGILLEMAKWKDHKFKEYLENKVKALQEENRIWRNNNLGSQIIILQRCIEEYFKEK